MLGRKMVRGLLEKRGYIVGRTLIGERSLWGKGSFGGQGISLIEGGENGDRKE